MNNGNAWNSVGATGWVWPAVKPRTKANSNLQSRRCQVNKGPRMKAITPSMFSVLCIAR